MMNRKYQVVFGGLLILSMILLLTACSAGRQQSGTAWGVGAFDSNGERIYFTSTSDSEEQISYTGGPATGMMMMGGYLTCASCHGPDGQGGVHIMQMQTMDAPDIRWSALEGEFDAETFRLGVVEGQDPDGTQMSSDMPHWKISDSDLADLIEFLKTLP